MAGGRAGGGPAADSLSDGTSTVTANAPITGDGSPGSPLAMAAATGANAGHMTAAQATALAALAAPYAQTQSVAGVSAQNIPAFTLLAGDTHEVYRIRAHIRADAGGQIGLTINGAAVAFLRNIVTTATGAPVQSASAFFASTGAGETAIVDLVLFAATRGGIRLGYFNVVTQGNQSTIFGSILWNNSADNITTIQVTGNTAAQYAVGTVARLQQERLAA